MKIESSIAAVLVSRWLDTEFEADCLAEISTETFNVIKNALIELCEASDSIVLSNDFIKDCWKQWFDWASTNGTLVAAAFKVVDNDGDYKHAELGVTDLLLDIAYKSIDRL